MRETHQLVSIIVAVKTMIAFLVMRKLHRLNLQRPEEPMLIKSSRIPKVTIMQANGIFYFLRFSRFAISADQTNP